MRNGADTGSPYSKHFRKEFLRERQSITAREVPGTQQPTAQASLSVVRRHAGHGLLGLTEYGLVVPNQRRHQCSASMGCIRQDFRVALNRIAGQLHYRAVQRNLAV